MDSLLAQSYPNTELILVDDGSQDGSLSLLQDYAREHQQVRVISRPQGGVSAARNAGMAQAQGKYLQFADADDYLQPNAVERFVELAESGSCDLVISDYYRVLSGRYYCMGPIRRPGLYTRRAFAQEMMRSPADFYYGVVWNKFFRLDIIRAHRLEFSDQLDWCEDFLFNLEYLEYTGNIYILKEPLYCYVKTKGSLSATSSIKGKMVSTKLELFQYYKELYQDLDLYEENKLRVHSFLIAVAREHGRRARKAEPKRPSRFRTPRRHRRTL